MRDQLSSHLTTLLLSFIGTLSMSGCSEPWCVPGRSVECACIGGGKGAQTCAPNGQEYLQCICPDVNLQQGAPSAPVERDVPAHSAERPLPTPIPSAQTSVVSKLVSSTTSSGSIRNSSPDNTNATLELAPIKLTRVSTSEPTGTNAQGTRMWWLINESTQSCELSDDIHATTHPAQLLAQGCYTKLSAHGKMRIKCDSAPMGPKSYLFAESHARCREILKPPSRALPSDFQRSSSRSSSRSTSAAPSAQVSAKRPTRAASYVKDTWHCMCYQELFQGQPSDSTACRKTRESCLDLESKVAEGSPVLIKGSMSVGCKRVKAKEPWDVFGVRYQWLHSSQPGAWWTPRGCFLDPSSRAKRRAASNRSRRSSTASTSAARPKAKRAPALPAVLTRPIEEEGRCAEACWAHLARDSERQQRFKQRSVPSRFDFAAPFARRVNLIVETCEARKRQQKSGSYRKECLRGGVKACVKLCERAQ